MSLDRESLVNSVLIWVECRCGGKAVAEPMDGGYQALVKDGRARFIMMR